MGTKPRIAGTMEVTDRGRVQIRFCFGHFSFSRFACSLRVVVNPSCHPGSVTSLIYSAMFTKAVNPPDLCFLCIDYRIWLHLFDNILRREEHNN